MLDANDLRIGNFVQNSEGKVCPVSQLFCDRVNSNKQITVSCDPPGKGSEILKPIPLTPTLLQSIGFKKKTYGNGTYFSNGSLTLTTEFRLCILHENTSTTIGESILNLHQLQNLNYNLHRNEIKISSEDVANSLNKT